MRLLLGLVFELVILGATPSLPAFRLPDVAKPIRYQLELTIIPREPTFRGVVRIEIELKQRTHLIWMNAKDLAVERARIETGERSLTARANVADEFLGLETDEPLGPGRVWAQIEYRGAMSEKSNDGVYRKRSGDDWYVFTTFTPIEARRAFPCFDEPGYKASWRMTLHVPRGDMAAANARAVAESDEPDGMKRVEFAETKPIPSEVAAFAVGPFDVVDAGVAGAHRVPVRILTPRGKAAQASAAREATGEVLARLEQYTGIPYPWDKLDHVAVLDMPFGAVENPGLITYRERALIADERRDTPEWRRRMRGVMAHELAHQWFGNLVTQAWWDDVWLSEGFATWLGTKMGDLELPAFARGIAAARNRGQMMRQDSTEGARPVRLAMNSRTDTRGVYSGTVYSKGAAILAMIENWVGEESFQKGIHGYLNSHAYGNATSADFAAALNSATGADVAPVLDSFLSRTGFPDVRAECADGRIGLTAPAGWMVPVCARGGDGETNCAVASAGGGSIALDRACPAWLWVNREGVGYFRSVADAGAIERLVKSGWDQLAAPERLSVVDDVAALASEDRIGGDGLRRFASTAARDGEPAVANAGLRLTLAALARAEGEERAKWLKTAMELVGAGRRR